MTKTNEHGDTPLARACFHPAPLVEECPDTVDMVNNYGVTAFRYNSASLEVMQFLIRRCPRAVKSSLVEDPHDELKTLSVLGSVTDNPDCLYVHLRANPAPRRSKVVDDLSSTPSTRRSEQRSSRQRHHWLNLLESCTFDGISKRSNSSRASLVSTVNSPSS
jgi:hypothetical protein